MNALALMYTTWVLVSYVALSYFGLDNGTHFAISATVRLRRDLQNDIRTALARFRIREIHITAVRLLVLVPSKAFEHNMRFLRCCSLGRTNVVLGTFSRTARLLLSTFPTSTKARSGAHWKGRLDAWLDICRCI